MITSYKFLSSAITAALTCVLHTTALAYTSNVDNLNLVVPDGDLDGVQNSQVLGGLAGSITHVSVTLNLSGGLNGDLYACLYHGSSPAVLLNRVGRSAANPLGYPDAGFGPDTALNQFVFDDQALHDVHLYRSFGYALNPSGQLTGHWQPDGRLLDPLSAAPLFDESPRLNPLSLFNAGDPNGVWTLYLADVSALGESTLLSWGLDLTIIPEPSVMALCLLGLGAMTLRSRGARRSPGHG